MYKNKHLFIVLLLLLIFIFGCSEEKTPMSYDSLAENSDQALIHARQALEENNLNYKSTNAKLEIKNYKTFLDKNNLPIFHIVNFENHTTKAFIIVSGDKRAVPILAYSKDNFFDFEGIMPQGVVDWLQAEEEYINYLRENNLPQIEAIKKQWLLVTLPENQLKMPIYKNEPTDPPCTGSYNLVVNPLLQTSWGQGCVYNAQCPSTCTSNCSHKLTGCVSTAMAQVLKYHHFQNYYNWASLQNHYNSNDFGLTGASEVARLMKDIGTSVNISYGCDASSASVNDIPDAFEQDFGYSNGGTLDRFLDKIETIKSNLQNGQPVIFRGCRTIHFGGLYYTDCHAWVGDGIMESYDCETGYSWLSHHMNWGWDGGYNGWYGVNSWTPGTKNYQYDREVIVNIHP